MATLSFEPLTYGDIPEDERPSFRAANLADAERDDSHLRCENLDRLIKAQDHEVVGNRSLTVSGASRRFSLPSFLCRRAVPPVPTEGVDQIGLRSSPMPQRIPGRTVQGS
ncbi:hypothetical protein C8039_19300 [Halogeometricum sp. wsp3]|nr:hypothetical protein C8039_19300 [Halogeometricum sp. wsp3]